MNEKQLEKKYLPYGTVKTKKELLTRIEVSPNKLNHGIKKFGEPIPITLIGVEEYAADLFDFLVDDFDSGYYQKFPELMLIKSLEAYVANSVWENKRKFGTIIDPICAVAINMAKVKKDMVTNMAQVVGRQIKTISAGNKYDDRELREKLIESCADSIEKTIGTLLIDIGLVPKEIGN